MKYMRKAPVEAIQWNGDNEREVSEFISHVTKSCSMWIEKSGNLMMFWKDLARRKFKAGVPKFGWVVRDGKTLQFYKDATFRKTFEGVQKDDYKGIAWEDMNKTIKEVFDSFNEAFDGYKDIFGSKLSKETLDEIKIGARTETDGCLFKMVDDVYKADDNTREEIKKNLSKGLKEMEDSDKTKGTDFDTFESVLDEMKELHAKKDKDYGSAFHKSFDEFGVTAGVVRLNDKMERVKSLVKNGKAEVKDEGLLDSLEDLACYAVMLYVELKNKEK